MKFRKLILITLSILLITGAVTNYNLVSKSQVTVDQDKDGLLDSQEDLNGDGILDDGETDPNNPDSDYDGYTDKTDTNPLDANINLFDLPFELDTNNDNSFDVFFSDIQLSTNFNLQRVTLADLTNNLECNTTNIVIDKTVLDCSLKLQDLADPTSNYTFSSDTYYIKFDDSIVENPCKLDENNQIYLTCKSIEYGDINIGSNNLKLFKKDYQNVIEDTNKNISVELNIDSRTIKSKELDSIVDASLERKCQPQLAEQTTSCTIKLPTNTTLTPEYQMGIDSNPGGQCEQIDDSQIVECTEVPVGTAYKSSLVNSTLNQNIQYSAIIAPPIKTEHTSTIKNPIKTYSFNAKAPFITLDGIEREFQEQLNLIIYDKNGQEVQKIFGFIDDQNNFRAIDEVNLSELLTPGLYDASIKSIGLDIKGIALEYKLKIEILGANTVRTGGDVNSYILFFILSILISLYLIKKKKTTFLCALILCNLIFSTLVYIPSITVFAAKPNTIDSGFGKIQCPNTTEAYYSKVLCTLEVKDKSKLDISLNYFLYFYQGEEIRTSNQCKPLRDGIFVCPELHLTVPGNIQVRIGASQETPDYKETIPPSALSEKSTTSFSIFVSNEKPTYNSNITNLAYMAIYSGIINKKLKFNYQTLVNLDSTKNVYVKVNNRLTGANILFSKMNKTYEGFYELEYTPTQSASVSVQYCVGVSTSNCKLSSSSTSVEFLPQFTTTDMYEANDKTADKINIVFKCGTEFFINGVNKCMEYTKPLLAWDGLPTYKDKDSKVTTPDNATSIGFGFFATEPLKSNKSKFNVFVINQLDDTAEEKSYSQIAESLQLNPKNTVFVKSMLEFGRSNATIPLGTNVNSLINKKDYQILSNDNTGYIKLYMGDKNAYKADTPNVLTHELGHALFGLGDEYSEALAEEAIPTYPNCMTSVNEAKTLWTKMNNGTDPVNKVDDNFNTFVNLYKNTYNKTYKKSLFDIYNQSDSQVFKSDNYKVSYQNFGSCYGPVDNKSILRPTKLGMMSNHYTSPIWGTVNRLRIDNVLSLFQSKSLCNVGTVNNKNCVVTNGCTNLATNSTCDNQKTVKASFCPLSSTLDKTLGYCSDTDNVYGVFPNALVNKCLKNTNNSKSCSNTNSYKINNSNINLLKYSKKLFKTLRTTSTCPFGTVKDSRAGDNCVEFNTKFPKDITKAYVFGPFAASTINQCLLEIDSKSKGTCYSGRLPYNFFDSIQ